MDKTKAATSIGMLGALGALAGVGLMLHYMDTGRFNDLAAGLTVEQRQVAEKFWKAARQCRSEEHAKYAAAMAKLRQVEAARVALEKLEQAIALRNDPTCDPDVAVWLVVHWLRETALVLQGKASLAMRMLADTNLDEELADLQRRALEHMEAANHG